MEAKFADGSHDVIGACIEVHRHLGPGLLESIYEEAPCVELRLRQIAYRRQVHVPVVYKDEPLDCAHRIDLVVEERIIVEIKAVAGLLPIHEAQVITYLRVTRLKTALLINFNVPVLTQGLRRLSLKSECSED